MILGHHTVSEFGLHISLAITNPYCYASKFFAFRHHKTPGILSVDHCTWSFYRNGNKGRSTMDSHPLSIKTHCCFYLTLPKHYR